MVFKYLPSESDCSYVCDFNNCMKVTRFYKPLVSVEIICELPKVC